MLRMRKTIAAVVTMLASSVSFSAAAVEIPKQLQMVFHRVQPAVRTAAVEFPQAFRGDWAPMYSNTSAAQAVKICTSTGPEAEAIATIDRKSYQGYEVYFELKKIAKSTPTKIIINGVVSVEGDNEPVAWTFELTEDGNILKTDDDTYIKCEKR